MKNLLVILFVVVAMAIGCAGAKPAGVADTALKTAKTTETICRTAKVLSDSGVEVPGVEQCEKIVEQLSSEEIMTIVDVLNCVKQYPVDSVECIECSIKAGWETLKPKLEKRKK